MAKTIQLAAALGGAILISASVSQLVHAKEKTALQKDRNAQMKILGQSMGQLKRALDTVTMREPAAAISNSTKKLTAMWPSGSGGPTTRAKAEIWTNLADFNAKMEAMQSAVDALIRVAAGSDLGAAKAAFGGVGRTCGGCHKVYRGPKI